MKYFTQMTLILSLFNCLSKTKINYNQGYIYNTEHKPIENIKLYGYFDTIKSIGKTNKDGFFKINIDKYNMVNFLIIKYENKIFDTIQTIHTHPEFGPKFFFVEGRSDTVFIDMDKRKKAYLGLDEEH